jgi:hypothetical protein
LDEGEHANDAAVEAASLEALGLTTAEATETYPKLDVYGFIDFTYWQPVQKADNRWAFVIPNVPSFQVGNINLYIASQMSKNLRSLLEVRFTYLPHGKNRSTQEDMANPAYISTAASDYTDSERPIKLGAIEIERVQLEYAPYEWLTLVMGQWLTPYGIWNVDHGTPTTMLAHRPYLVGEELIPERQTGIMAQGALRVGSNRFGYHFGISNGRGPLDSYYDMDKNKAVTARVFWQNYSVAGDFTLGGSTYVGRFTDAQRSLKLVAEGKAIVIKPVDTVKVQYDERTFSADAQLTRGGLRLFSELAMNIREYTDTGRPPVGGLFALIEPTKANALTPDQRRWGGYLTGGYRFDWFGVMPLAQIEYFRLDDPVLPQVFAWYAGVNIRPHESVTFKLHYGQAHFLKADSRGPGKDTLQIVESQVAWAF